LIARDNGKEKNTMGKKRGKFIVFEGVDGAGTTTQSKLLFDRLNKLSGIKTMWEAEPTSYSIGAFIREHYLSGEVKLPDWKTMAMLFSADRQEHSIMIESWLEDGWWCVCDRYYWSTYAYQVAMTGDENYKWRDHVAWMEKLSENVVRPDATYFLRLGPAEAAKRRAKRDEKPEVYETDDMQERVNKAYLMLVKLMSHVDNATTFDGADDIEKLHERIWKIATIDFPMLPK